MPKHSNLIARNVASCGADRMVALELSEDITRNTISIKESKFESFVRVGGRHLAGMAGELGIPEIEVLKLDIEGAELEETHSLDDEFFRRISQITVEFHDSLKFATTREVFERIERLKKRCLGAVLEPTAKHRRCPVDEPPSHGANPPLVRAANHPQVEGACTSAATSAVKSGVGLNLCR
jgi:Methyltransferase FkbM domain